MKSLPLFLLHLSSLVLVLVLAEGDHDGPDHHSFLLPFSGYLDNSTVLLSHSDQDLDNNPLDNLSDLSELSEIHKFEIDLSNYTDHEAVEALDTDVEHNIPEFNDHFDILPNMDTRDYTKDYHNTSEETETLNPNLYEVVTSAPNGGEASGTDSSDMESNGNGGMDEKYFALLENLRKKILREQANGQDEEKEIHQEENDVMHPLISLMTMKPNSMRLLVKPKTLDLNSKVRLMYKRVPRNKAAHRKHLDDPIIEIIPLYRNEQEHFINDLPRGKYIVCGDHSIQDVIVQHNCFETIVDRLDNNELQGGVVCIIALAILVFLSCNCYAIYHRCMRTEQENQTKS